MHININKYWISIYVSIAWCRPNIPPKPRFVVSLSCNAGSLAIHSHSDSKPLMLKKLKNLQKHQKYRFPSLLFQMCPHTFPPFLPHLLSYAFFCNGERQSSLTRRKNLGCIAWPKQGPPARGCAGHSWLWVGAAVVKKCWWKTQCYKMKTWVRRHEPKSLVILSLVMWKRNF